VRSVRTHFSWGAQVGFSHDNSVGAFDEGDGPKLIDQLIRDEHLSPTEQVEYDVSVEMER
jgi:hypothetical protein